MTTILVAGVAVLDFIFKVDALPERAEKYRAIDAAVAGGGCAGNASVAIARLGGRAIIAARLGDDTIGDQIVAGLDREGVDCGLARRFAGARSSFSSILVDKSGERQIVNFRDMSISFGADWLKAALPPSVDAALADTRWPQGGAIALEHARGQGRPAVLDAEAPIAEAPDALAAATHIAFSASGLRDFAPGHDLAASLLKARAMTGAWVAVTDGSRGTMWIDQTDRVQSQPAYAVGVVDTLGAGDVWHGAFALALGEGMADRDAIRFASAAAALKCTRFGGGSGAPHRAETEALMRTLP